MENLQEGVKNESLIKKKASVYTILNQWTGKEHCGYLGKSLMDPSTKCITNENTHMVEFLPKRQIQESTKLGLKPLRNGVCNRA